MLHCVPCTFQICREYYFTNIILGRQVYMYMHIMTKHVLFLLKTQTISFPQQCHKSCITYAMFTTFSKRTDSIIYFKLLFVIQKVDYECTFIRNLIIIALCNISNIQSFLSEFHALRDKSSNIIDIYHILVG